MGKPKSKPLLVKTRVPPATGAKPRRRATNPYFLGLYTAIVGTLVAGVGGMITGFIPAMFAPSPDNPHQYSITTQGRTITGESTNPFVDAQGYQARIEVCETHGVEGILIAVSCYLTIRPTQNLTISNSRNPTTATYQDGSVATICCMAIGDNHPMPLYRVGLPRGSISRRSFRQGEEVQVHLNIPDADSGRTMDAISFSPGEGAPAVLFPLRGNVVNRVFSAEFINSRRGDPRIEELIRDTIELRDQLRSQAPQNEGLTYPANEVQPAAGQ